MQFKHVTLDFDGPVAILKLDHQEVMNAVSMDMLGGLGEALDAIDDKRDEVRCLVLTGAGRAAFPLEGEDWFELADDTKLSWKKIVATLDAAQQRLSQAVAEVASGARTSPLGEAERFDLIVGITGHAAYHAGQIQLIKKLI